MGDAEVSDLVAVENRRAVGNLTMIRKAMGTTSDARTSPERLKGSATLVAPGHGSVRVHRDMDIGLILRLGR